MSQILSASLNQVNLTNLKQVKVNIEKDLLQRLNKLKI